MVPAHEEMIAHGTTTHQKFLVGRVTVEVCLEIGLLAVVAVQELSLLVLPNPKEGHPLFGKTDRPHCQHYIKGKCTKGNSCDFWHTPLCKFHTEGKCTAGQDCTYLHVDTANLAPDSPKPKAESTAEPKPKADSKAKAKPKVNPLLKNPIFKRRK